MEKDREPRVANSEKTVGSPDLANPLHRFLTRIRNLLSETATLETEKLRRRCLLRTRMRANAAKESP